MSESITDRSGVPLTADELRRRAIAAAATAEDHLLSDPSPENAQAWVAVAHALIAAAGVQARIEAETCPVEIGPEPGYSLR
jgi:hypothetical protein